MGVYEEAVNLPSAVTACRYVGVVHLVYCKAVAVILKVQLVTRIIWLMNEFDIILILCNKIFNTHLHINIINKNYYINAVFN